MQDYDKNIHQTTQQIIGLGIGSGQPIGGKRVTRLNPSSRPDQVSEGSRNTPQTGDNPSLQSFGATKNSLKNGTPAQQFHDPNSQYLFGNNIRKSPKSSSRTKYTGSAKQNRDSHINKDGSEARTGENQSEFEASPTFNHNTDSVNTPTNKQNNMDGLGDYSRKSVPSPSNRGHSKSKKSNQRNQESRGNSANLLRSPALQLDVNRKQQSNPISTIKKTMNNNNNHIAIGKIPTRNDRTDTDEESAQFVAKPSTVDSNDLSGCETGNEYGGPRRDSHENPQGYVSGYNSGYSSGQVGGASPRVARFKAKTAGIRKQWAKKPSTKRKSSKNKDLIKVQNNESQENFHQQYDFHPPSDLGTVNEQEGEQSYQTQEARNLALVNFAKNESVTTPTPNTHNISDMNPMLSQTTSHRGSHVIPQNFTLSGQLQVENVQQQRQYPQQQQPTNKLQRKKSFSSNEFQDQLRRASNRLTHQPNSSREIEIEDQQEKKQQQNYNVKKMEKIEVEIQKTSPIKPITHVVKTQQFKTPVSPKSKRSNQQSSNPATSKKNQGKSQGSQRSALKSNVKASAKDKGNQGGNPSLHKSKEDLSASISEFQQSIVNGETDAKVILIKKEETLNHQNQPGGMRPKGKAIDPYIKSEHSQKSLKKFSEQPEYTPEQYQDMIEQYMQDHEQQFEVFETGPDGEFKPIFMVGKCPPPEKELLKQSILSTLSNRSGSRGGNTPRSRDQQMNFSRQDYAFQTSVSHGEGLNRDLNSGPNVQLPKFMPGSLSNVSGLGYNTALSVIQSESREETERSTVQNVNGKKSGLPSKKQLHTEESAVQNASAVNGMEIASQIAGSAVAGPELNQSIQIIENNNRSQHLDTQQVSQKGKPNVNLVSAVNTSTSNYDQLLASQQQQQTTKLKGNVSRANNANNLKTMPASQKRNMQHHPIPLKPASKVGYDINLTVGNQYGLPVQNQRVGTPKNLTNKSLNDSQKLTHQNQRVLKPTVKRIGVDLNSQPKKSVRNSSASAKRPSTQMSRQQNYQEAAKTIRKNSLKSKRQSEHGSANLYNQMGPAAQQIKRPASSQNRLPSHTDGSSARRNNGRQPKNSEIKTVNVNFDINVRNNSVMNKRSPNNDLSDMDGSMNDSSAIFYATARTSNLRDSLNSATVLKGGNQHVRKSFTTNNSDAKQNPNALGSMQLSLSLTDRLLEDYENSQKLGPANKKDKNFIRVWEKVLEKFDKKTYQICNQKDFKTLMRALNLVPNFTSEYRASQVFNAHETYMINHQNRISGQPLKKFETLRCVYLVFSVSTSIQDIQLYGPHSNASGNQSVTGTEQADLKELQEKLHNVAKGANIYEIDTELAQKMNEARNKFLKQWIKQQVKLSGKN